MTADALHTVETAKALVKEVGAHAVLVVKRDRPALWEACRSIPWSEVTARHKESEVSHDRLETRVAQAVTWTSLAFPPVAPIARITQSPHRHSWASSAYPPTCDFAEKIRLCVSPAHR